MSQHSGKLQSSHRHVEHLLGSESMSRRCRTSSMQSIHLRRWWPPLSRRTNSHSSQTRFRRKVALYRILQLTFVNGDSVPFQTNLPHFRVHSSQSWHKLVAIATRSCEWCSHNAQQIVLQYNYSTVPVQWRFRMSIGNGMNILYGTWTTTLWVKKHDTLLVLITSLNSEQTLLHNDRYISYHTLNMLMHYLVKR